ncbi:hypothetical protein K501DRAFT_328450 [Backusella circina FSU 941]|nr:hypothetical protein K501DRAFT_328450 [Backusella circina FSU 941]
MLLQNDQILKISFLPQLNNTQKTILKQQSPSVPPSTTSPSPQIKKTQEGQEKYLSWFPHSGFPEQHESFRNGLRLAIETNRTIIAPMLRINPSYMWMPFEQLAKGYEAQDKPMLRKACEKGESNWRTELQPCDTINEWTEIAWSSIMDLEILKKEYGVRIIERQGHGWGVDESALADHVDPDDVTVVDVMSFEENGTNWEHADASNDIQQNQFSPMKWIQTLFELKTKKKNTLQEPLKNVFSIAQLNAIDTKIIQFGALNSAARYQTTATPLQQELRKAMMKNRFVAPDRLKHLTDQSNRIINVLGGKYQYSTLILNLTKLVEMDARAAELTPDGDQQQQTMGLSSIEQLGEKARLELMDAVVLEVFGDIPINQAISAALPIKPSKLATLLAGSLYDADRQQLLEACTDYHKNIESRYPIYYIMNDMGIAPETRPDIFGPLLKMFPCIFSRWDMHRWGVLTDNWSSGQPELADSDVNYEDLLQPLMDILIAQKAYSFFEIPTTPLTRFLNWGSKN